MKNIKNKCILLISTITAVGILLCMTAAANRILAAAEEKTVGQYSDGTYDGSGNGFRGELNVTVSIANGRIAAIDIIDYKDDIPFFSRAESEIIPGVIEKQSADVDAVSGATYSSKGLLEAINKALDQSMAADRQLEGNDKAADISEHTLSLEHLSDGNYKGTGTGFRGEIEVEVSVKEHDIEMIRIISYYDNEEYFFHAAGEVIDSITENRDLDVDAVSGATYSANGLTGAIADALEVDEELFTILETKKLGHKDKDSHHVTQKFVESEEEQGKLIEKYKELIFGKDGKRK